MPVEPAGARLLRRLTGGMVRATVILKTGAGERTGRPGVGGRSKVIRCNNRQPPVEAIMTRSSSQLVGRLICLSAALTVLLGVSCSGPQNLPDDVALLATSDEGLNPAAASLLAEAKRHARTRLAGSATGGLAGVIASVASTGGSSGGMRGAVSGAAGGIGAAIGYAFGDYIDARSTRANMDAEKLTALVGGAKRDNARYEQDLINIKTALRETQAVVEQLRRQYGGRHPPDAYRAPARNLRAVAAVIKVTRDEQVANATVMSQDILEAQDVREMGSKEVQPETLETERTRLLDEREKLASLHATLIEVNNQIPPAERPEINLIP